MSTVSREASEAELDPSRTSVVENKDRLEVGPDDETEHMADKGHPRCGQTIPESVSE
jgi:hypothetical protein